MSLISGLLLAYDFLPKTGRWLEFHQNLRKRLQQVDTDNLTSKGTLYFNMMISLFLFLMILCWVYYDNRDVENKHLYGEILSFFIGVVIAFVVISILTITKVVKKPLKNIDRLLLIYFALAIIVLVVIAALSPAWYIVAGGAAAIYMFILFPFASISANYIRKALLAHPEKEYHIFAVLGFVLFICSSLIQIFGD